ncbi:MAG TPA: ATP-binding cassette domain-containing protein [Acidimicrobiia bacterium]|nr:ATP-binding cassette domain-containing protein [Acidimicrobiia bacterium]
MSDTIAIEMRGITKAFGETVANDGIDFSVRAGEIHVLLGENGAGKTTLMNILFGHMQSDEGVIFVDGDQVEIAAPNDAIAHGIGMVHQHFSLVPSFTVAENVMLGVNRVTDLSFGEDAIEKAVSQRAAELHMPIQPDATV